MHAGNDQEQILILFPEDSPLSAPFRRNLNGPIAGHLIGGALMKGPGTGNTGGAQSGMDEVRKLCGTVYYNRNDLRVLLYRSMDTMNLHFVELSFPCMDVHNGICTQYIIRIYYFILIIIGLILHFCFPMQFVFDEAILHGNMVTYVI